MDGNLMIYLVGVFNLILSQTYEAQAIFILVRRVWACQDSHSNH